MGLSSYQPSTPLVKTLLYHVYKHTFPLRYSHLNYNIDEMHSLKLKSHIKTKLGSKPGYNQNTTSLTTTNKPKYTLTAHVPTNF